MAHEVKGMGTGGAEILSPRSPIGKWVYGALLVAILGLGAAFWAGVTIGRG